MPQTLVVRVIDIFKGLDSAEAHIIIGKIEISVRPPVFAPAVFHDPRAVSRRLMLFPEIGRREGIVPAHNTDGVVARFLFVRILRVDHRIFPDEVHIALHDLIDFPDCFNRTAKVRRTDDHDQILRRQ